MMLSTRVRRIFLVEHGVDFRRQHNGLLAEAYRLKLDPFQGDLLLFVGRKRNRIKVLYADPTGLWVSAKVFTLETMNSLETLKRYRELMGLLPKSEKGSQEKHAAAI